MKEAVPFTLVSSAVDTISSLAFTSPHRPQITTIIIIITTIHIGAILRRFGFLAEDSLPSFLFNTVFSLHITHIILSLSYFQSSNCSRSLSPSLPPALSLSLSLSSSMSSEAPTTTTSRRPPFRFVVRCVCAYVGGERIMRIERGENDGRRFRLLCQCVRNVYECSRCLAMYTRTRAHIYNRMGSLSLFH